MKTQLFTGENWDQLNTAHLYFYGATLSVDVGKFKKGYTGDIDIDYKSGVLNFYSPDKSEVIASYNLLLQVGEERDPAMT